MSRQGCIGGDPPAATPYPWEDTDVPVKYQLIGTPHSDESVTALYRLSTRVIGDLSPPETHSGTEWVTPTTCTQLHAAVNSSLLPLYGGNLFAKDIQSLIQRWTDDLLSIVILM